MDIQVDRIIEKIYDAALDPREWTGLLTEIASAIGAIAGFYAGLDIRHGRGAFWYTVGHDERMATLYNEHYLAVDPTLAHIIKSPGNAFSCCEYLSDADVAVSRIHTEFMIPNGIRYVLSGVVSMQGSMVSFFGFQRHISQEPFTRIEADFLQRLIPHFAKADQVAAKVSTISDAKRLAMTVLDRLDFGIVIVNRAGHVRMTNQRAEQWLQSGDVVHSLFGRIRLANAKDNEVLEKLVRTAASGDNGDMQAKSIETTANHGDVRARIVVLPISNDEQRQLDDDEASVTIIISDQNQQRAMAPQVLQDSYGLTVAETRVATGLAGGQTQDELCESLFVSLATIKTHTQHIYQKTGVSRQADLVRLVYGLPALF
jgi:DNA-binding CsgD family transcriptional regulator